MSGLLSGLAIIAGAVVGIVIVVRAALAYIEGLVDGEFPLTAEGDWREGWLRLVYLIGRHRGERAERIKAKRRRITAERRNERLRGGGS